MSPANDRRATTAASGDASPDADPNVPGWDVIEDALDEDSPTRAESHERLMTHYWSAVYAYIRSSGRAPNEAEDLTQGFFADVVLGRDLFRRADRTRGTVRSLLLSSVRNYLADEFRMRTAKRRSPGKKRLVSLDVEESGYSAVSDTPSPEGAFNRRWLDALLRRTAEQVRAYCLSHGQEAHWDIFERRILRPSLEGATPVPHNDLARHWGLAGLPQVANLLVTVKRRFANQLLENVRATLGEGNASRNEMADLLAALNLDDR